MAIKAMMAIMSATEGLGKSWSISIAGCWEGDRILLPDSSCRRSSELSSRSFVAAMAALSFRAEYDYGFFHRRFEL